MQAHASSARDRPEVPVQQEQKEQGAGCAETGQRKGEWNMPRQRSLGHAYHIAASASSWLAAESNMGTASELGMWRAQLVLGEPSQIGSASKRPDCATGKGHAQEAVCHYGVTDAAALGRKLLNGCLVPPLPPTGLRLSTLTAKT